MRKTAKIISTATAIAALMGSLSLAPINITFAAEKKALTPVQKGKKLAFNKKKGNCLSCHAIAGGKMAGNVGPPLVAMKARYPDKKKLRAQIWDATKANPNTVMPPFGRHKILSEKEIDLVTEFISTL
ncbi:MAG TPA: sulfur oxidation c-type cytochrome SoxX [Gammaproteobacteria bacterium]|nr:sulfur oxidation c-type cytochrome SoxX [Gammaproteobacteria bacterium]